MSDIIRKIGNSNWIHFAVIAIWAFSCIGMAAFVLCSHCNVAIIVALVVLISTGVPFIRKEKEKI